MPTIFFYFFYIIIIIRLNAFFELKDKVDSSRLKILADELIAASRLDEGNMGYDLFQSTTNPRVYMFCETWENGALLEKHSHAPHFTRLVPQINALTKDGTKLERFDRNVISR